VILYTLLAPEEIFGWAAAAAADSVTCEEVEGRPCLVRTTQEGRRYLERLLSTDPQDFLDPRFAPGRPVP
jgi:hypothetical protein